MNVSLYERFFLVGSETQSRFLMLYGSTEEELNCALQQHCQSKHSRTTFRVFLNEFQVLLLVIDTRREVHHLVGLSKSDSVCLP